MSSSLVRCAFFASKSFSRTLVFPSFLILAFLTLYLISPSPASAVTLVSGTISQNTTWTTTGSPYVLTGNSVTVAAGVTLTVQPGVVVKAQQSSTSLLVNGALNADQAIFTSYKDDAYGGDTNGDGSATSPVPGDWAYLQFNGGSGTLIGCTVLYAGGYYSNLGAIYIVGSSPTITGSTISSSKTSGIYVSSGSPAITNNTVSDGEGAYGIRSSSMLAALFGNNITGNANAIAVSVPATLGEGAVYNNTYSGNKQNAMFLHGDIEQNTTLPASNSPYVLNASFVTTVENNSALTVDPDVVVKFKDNVYNNALLRIAAGSTLNATGAIFTSHFEDMIKITLEKGERYWDPKNKVFNYILREGYASGKDLLVGQNPITKQITTVIRGSDLSRPRMVPLP